MGLSKRERIIVLATILVVGALVGDRLVLSPVTGRWGELTGSRQQLRSQVVKAQGLLEQRKLIEQNHKTLFENLRPEADAESRVAEAIDQWSRDARLALSSVTPSRAVGDKGLKEMIFVIAGRGSLDAVAGFLCRAETSELPVKVKYMQLGSTSEAGDNLSLELRLSTLYVAADEKPSSKQRQPRQAEKTNEEQL